MIIRKDGYKSRVNSSSYVRDMCISSQVTLYSIMITRESEVLTPSASQHRVFVSKLPRSFTLSSPCDTAPEVIANIH